MKRNALWATVVGLALGCGSPVSPTATLRVRGSAARGIPAVLMVDELDNENHAAKCGPDGSYEFDRKGSELTGSWLREKDFHLQAPADVPPDGAYVTSDSFTLRGDLKAPFLRVWDPKIDLAVSPEGGLKVAFSPAASGPDFQSIGEIRIRFHYRDHVNLEKSASEIVDTVGRSFSPTDLERLLPDRGETEVRVWLTAAGDGEAVEHFPNFTMGLKLTYQSKRSRLSIPFSSSHRLEPKSAVEQILKKWTVKVKSVEDDRFQLLHETAKLGEGGRTQGMRDFLAARNLLLSGMVKLLDVGGEPMPEVVQMTDNKDGTWLCSIKGIGFRGGKIQSAVVEESGGKFLLRSVLLTCAACQGRGNGCTVCGGEKVVRKNPAQFPRLAENLASQTVIHHPYWVRPKSETPFREDRSTAKAAAATFAELLIREQVDISKREEALLRGFLTAIGECVSASCIGEASADLDQSLAQSKEKFSQLRSGVRSVEEQGAQAVAILRTNAGFTYEVQRRIVLKKVGAEWFVDEIRRPCTCTEGMRPSCSKCSGAGWVEE